MASFEDSFYLENPTRAQVLRRNLALIWWLGQKLWFWLVKGRAVRKAYRAAEGSGQPLVLEELFDGQD